MAAKYPLMTAPYYRIARLTPAATDAYSKYKEAQKLADTARARFEKVAMETPQIQALMVMIAAPNSTAMFDYNREIFKIQTYAGSSSGFSFEFEKQQQQAYLDPKTINLLLSGRLLTDEQKLKLLKQQGLDILADETADPDA